MNVGGSPAPLDVSFAIIDGSGATTPFPATKLNPHDIVWTRIVVTAATTGACCKPDGSCAATSASGCGALYNGSYSGNNTVCGSCTQPPVRACCQTDGTCILATQAGCTSYPGAYRGDSPTCAAASCDRTLSTGVTGGGGFATPGAVFLNATAPADHPLLITGFDYSPTQAYNNVTFYPVMDIYTRPGGYVGFEFGNCASEYQPNGWVLNTQVTTIPYPVGGSDSTIHVTLASPVTVPAGQTIAFYLLVRASGIATNTTGPTTFSDPGEIMIQSDESRGAGAGSAAITPNWSGALSTTTNTFRGRIYYRSTGACCISEVCTTTTEAACTGTFRGLGTACTPNACVTGTGACCCGSRCTITTAGNCTGINQSFAGAGLACTPFSFRAPCCRADFNKNGAVTVQDIFDFLTAYFTTDPCGDTNDTGAVTVQDIFDYLTAYFGGC
jgi:hypothetical protein